MRKHFFLFFIFLSSFMHSQELISLKGKITAASFEGAAINIINLPKDTGTISLPSGEFEVEVSKGDTLVFISLQYEELKVPVTSEVLEKAFLEVQLIEKLNELEEVYISNINLTGNLSYDLSQIQTFNQADFGFPLKDRLTPLERRRQRYKSTALSSVFSTLNGSYNQLEKFEKIETLKSVVEKGMQAAPETFFTEDLKIPKEHIINFVHFCAENPNFPILLKKERALDLIAYYQKKAPAFLERLKGEVPDTADKDKKQ